jgi:hypothetical protein
MLSVFQISTTDSPTRREMLVTKNRLRYSERSSHQKYVKLALLVARWKQQYKLGVPKESSTGVTHTLLCHLKVDLKVSGAIPYLQEQSSVRFPRKVSTIHMYF